MRLAFECGQSWDALDGDARERRCALCDQRVVNLSALTQRQAALVPVTTCVRFLADADGHVIHQPEPHQVAPRPRSMLLALALTQCNGNAGSETVELPVVASTVVSPTGEACPQPRASGSPTVQPMSEYMGKPAAPVDHTRHKQADSLLLMLPGENIRPVPLEASGKIEARDIHLTYARDAQGQVSFDIDSAPSTRIKVDHVDRGLAPIRGVMLEKSRVTRFELTNPKWKAAKTVLMRLQVN